MSIIFGVLPRIFVQPPRKDERAFDYRVVFDRRYPRVQCVRRIVRHDVHFFLHEDRPRVAARIHKMHGAAAFLFAFGDDRLL